LRLSGRGGEEDWGTGRLGDWGRATNEFCVHFGEILNIEIGDRRKLGLGQSQIENPKSKIFDNITKELN